MNSVLAFVGLPPLNPTRFQCLQAHKTGMFQRKRRVLDSSVLEAFPQQMRLKLDAIIEHVNYQILVPRGYKEMPLDAYKFYRKVRIELFWMQF